MTMATATLAIGLGLLAMAVGELDMCIEVLNSDMPCDEIFSSKKCSFAYTPLANPSVSCQDLEEQWEVINRIRCRCQSNGEHQAIANMLLVDARRALLMGGEYHSCHFKDPCNLPVLTWEEEPAPEF